MVLFFSPVEDMDEDCYSLDPQGKKSPGNAGFIKKCSRSPPGPHTSNSLPAAPTPAEEFNSARKGEQMAQPVADARNDRAGSKSDFINRMHTMDDKNPATEVNTD